MGNEISGTQDPSAGGLPLVVQLEALLWPGASGVVCEVLLQGGSKVEFLGEVDSAPSDGVEFLGEVSSFALPSKPFLVHATGVSSTLAINVYDSLSRSKKDGNAAGGSGLILASVRLPISRLVHYGLPLYTSLWLGLTVGGPEIAKGSASFERSLQMAKDPDTPKLRLAFFKPCTRSMGILTMGAPIMSEADLNGSNDTKMNGNAREKPEGKLNMWQSFPRPDVYGAFQDELDQGAGCTGRDGALGIPGVTLPTQVMRLIECLRNSNDTVSSLQAALFRQQGKACPKTAKIRASLTDADGLTDAVCICQVGPKGSSSAVFQQKSTDSGDYSECSNFPLGESLYFRVRPRDPANFDTVLAQCCLECSEFFPQGFCDTLTLFDATSGFRATVKAEITVVEEADVDAGNEQPASARAFEQSLEKVYLQAKKDLMAELQSERIARQAAELALTAERATAAEIDAEIVVGEAALKSEQAKDRMLEAGQLEELTTKLMELQTKLGSLDEDNMALAQELAATRGREEALKNALGEKEIVSKDEELKKAESAQAALLDMQNKLAQSEQVRAERAEAASLRDAVQEATVLDLQNQLTTAQQSLQSYEQRDAATQQTTTQQSLQEVAVLQERLQEAMQREEALQEALAAAERACAFNQQMSPRIEEAAQKAQKDAADREAALDAALADTKGKLEESMRRIAQFEQLEDNFQREKEVEIRKVHVSYEVQHAKLRAELKVLRDAEENNASLAERVRLLEAALAEARLQLSGTAPEGEPPRSLREARETEIENMKAGLQRESSNSQMELALRQRQDMDDLERRQDATLNMLNRQHKASLSQLEDMVQSAMKLHEGTTAASAFQSILKEVGQAREKNALQVLSPRPAESPTGSSVVSPIVSPEFLEKSPRLGEVGENSSPRSQTPPHDFGSEGLPAMRIGAEDRAPRQVQGTVRCNQCSALNMINLEGPTTVQCGSCAYEFSAVWDPVTEKPTWRATPGNPSFGGLGAVAEEPAETSNEQCDTTSRPPTPRQTPQQMLLSPRYPDEEAGDRPPTQTVLSPPSTSELMMGSPPPTQLSAGRDAS